MGFYDMNCFLTGVSLVGAHAVLVPLAQTDTGVRPISFGIHGTYDRPHQRGGEHSWSVVAAHRGITTGH